MALEVVIAPTVEPVSVAELKTLAGIDYSDHDTLLGTIIEAVRRQGENKTRRTWVDTEFRLRLDAFPAVFELPGPPLLSVESLKYYDTDNVEQTLTEDTDYEVDIHSIPGRVQLVDGQSWPEIKTRMNAVTIQFKAGYAVEAGVATTPADLKLWLLKRATDAYEHRGGLFTGGQLQELPRDFVDGLLDKYRVPGTFTT